MPRPTPRAVLIFAAGIPLALFVVIYQPSWWVLSFNYGVLVVLAALTDLLLAFPPRLLNVKVVPPDRLLLGERGATTVTLAAARSRRSTRFEVLAEQTGDIDPSEIVAGTLPPGQEAKITLPLVPRRRGQVKVVAVWLRWRGS